MHVCRLFEHLFQTIPHLDTVREVLAAASNPGSRVGSPGSPPPRPMAPAPWRVALAVAAAALRPARADECAGDFVVVLDRSNSIGNKWWNHRNDGEGVIDFLESLVDALDPCDGADAGCAATTRVAMVVFPAYDGGDYEDDWSGGAKIVQGLTTDPDVYTGSNGILTNVGTGKNACDSDPNDGSADSVMSWPCGGWAWTPTWLGLEAAYDELFVNSYDPSSIKTVILVTDGLPSNNAAVGSKFERPVHLTLEAATKLKDKIATESASGRVFGVGVGGNYEDIGTSPCEPFCDHYKGEGLFMGNYASGTTYSGEVTIEGFDGSDAYCGSAPSCYPECTESQHNAASNKEGCGTYTASATHDSLVTGDTVSEKYENIVSLSSSADLIDNVDVIKAGACADPPAPCTSCGTANWTPTPQPTQDSGPAAHQTCTLSLPHEISSPLDSVDRRLA